MPSNKDKQKSDSRSSMADSSMDKMSERDFETQGRDENSERGGTAQSTASSHGYGKDTGMQGNSEEDDMSTAGGREGQFSDKNRGSEGQWSPGSGGGSSDE